MNPRELTRSELMDKTVILGWSEVLLNELQRLGVILPDPPEPKKLTHIEAAAVIGSGGKVKSRKGKIYPSRDNHITLNKDFEPYTEVVETVEIDMEVFVNVYSDGRHCIHDSKQSADRVVGSSRISCEKFHLRRSVPVRKGE